MADNLPLVLVDGSSFLYRSFYASKQRCSNWRVDDYDTHDARSFKEV